MENSKTLKTGDVSSASLRQPDNLEIPPAVDVQDHLARAESGETDRSTVVAAEQRPVVDDQVGEADVGERRTPHAAYPSE